MWLKSYLSSITCHTLGTRGFSRVRWEFSVLAEAALVKSLEPQGILVITCHFNLKKANGIAIHTQNFRKKKFSKMSVVSHVIEDL